MGLGGIQVRCQIGKLCVATYARCGKHVYYNGIQLFIRYIIH